jgi:hypothetical protein
MQVQRQFVDVKQRTMSIELPESFVNRRVEVIVLTIDDEPQAPVKRRRPHPEIAGKGRTLGDLLGPVVDERDWDCLK